MLLLQLVQIIINTTHLERSCRFLEEFITNITNVLPETVHTTKLYGMATFKVSLSVDPHPHGPLGGPCLLAGDQSSVVLIQTRKAARGRRKADI